MISNEEMLAFVRKSPIAVGAGLAALLLGVGIYFRGDGLPAAQTQLDEKSAEGRRLAFNVRNAAQLPDQLAVLTAAAAEMQPRLVRSDELAKNLQYFYKLEAETGTKLTDLRQIPLSAAAARAAKAGPKSAFSTVVFTVALQGEYLALLDFLRRLENGVHYARVMQASVSMGSVERTGPLTLQLTVELLGQPTP